MANPLRRKGVVVKTTVVWDHPLYEAVIRQAVRSGTEIVFKDTHHHTALARASFSNTDWNLIRTSPVPLWLVKPHAIKDPSIFVAAIDPLNQHDKLAALDDAILRLSKAIAENVNGQVHAFHSYDPRAALAIATANIFIPNSFPINEIAENIREQHQKRFKEITDFHGIKTEQAHQVAGLTHEELLALAANINATVVVMGAVARNPWQRLFVGATAERTLQQLPCDLLVVKPDWFHTPVNSEQKSHVPELREIEKPNDKTSDGDERGQLSSGPEAICLTLRSSNEYHGYSGKSV